MSYLLDICENQSLDKIKGKSIKLLDSMCQYVDGFLRFIVHLYMDLLHYVIEKEQKIKIHEYTILNNPQFELLIKNLLEMKDIEIFDQVFLIFASLSYLIYMRKDLINYYVSEITKINHVLIKISDEFLKTKLSVFYSFNDDIFIHDVDDYSSQAYLCFNQQYDFLFENLISNNKNVVVNLQALDALNSLITESKIVPLLSRNIKSKIPLLYSLVTKSNSLTDSNLFLEFMKDLLKTYSKSISEEIYVFFKYFWNEITEDIKFKINKKQQNLRNLRACKVFDCLKCIHAIINIESSNKAVIFNEIFQIFEVIDKISDFDYEEEIIILLSNTIKISKSIPLNYVNSAEKIFLMIEGKNYDIEKYRLKFIITFFTNLDKENLMKYKEKLFEFIRKIVFFNEKNTSSLLNKHYFGFSLFYAYLLAFDEFLVHKDLEDCMNTIITRLNNGQVNFGNFVKRLCDCFILLTIMVFSKGSEIIFLENINHLETIVVKCMNCQEKYFDNQIELSVTLVFYIKILEFFINRYESKFDYLISTLYAYCVDGLINMSKNLTQNNSLHYEKKNNESDLVSKIMDENDKEDLYVIGKKCEERSKITNELINIPKPIKFKVDQDICDDFDSDENEENEENENDDQEEEEENEENNDSMLDYDSLMEKDFEGRDEIEQRIKENIKAISDKFVNEENKGNQKDFLLKSNIFQLKTSELLDEFPIKVNYLNEINEIAIFNQVSQLLKQKLPELHTVITNKMKTEKMKLISEMSEMSKIIIDRKPFVRKIKKIKQSKKN